MSKRPIIALILGDAKFRAGMIFKVRHALDNCTTIGVPGFREAIKVSTCVRLDCVVIHERHREAYYALILMRAPIMMTPKFVWYTSDPTSVHASALRCLGADCIVRSGSQENLKQALLRADVVF